LLEVLRWLDVLPPPQLRLHVVSPYIATAGIDAIIVPVYDDVAVFDVDVAAPMVTSVIVVVAVVVVAKAVSDQSADSRAA
jgi:hypothetical protein